MSTGLHTEIPAVSQLLSTYGDDTMPPGIRHAALMSLGPFAKLEGQLLDFLMGVAAESDDFRLSALRALHCPLQDGELFISRFSEMMILFNGLAPLVDGDDELSYVVLELLWRHVSEPGVRDWLAGLLYGDGQFRQWVYSLLTMSNELLLGDEFLLEIVAQLKKVDCVQSFGFFFGLLDGVEVSTKVLFELFKLCPFVMGDENKGEEWQVALQTGIAGVLRNLHSRGVLVSHLSTMPSYHSVAGATACRESLRSLPELFRWPLEGLFSPSPAVARGWVTVVMQLRSYPGIEDVLGALLLEEVGYTSEEVSGLALCLLMALHGPEVDCASMKGLGVVQALIKRHRDDVLKDKRITMKTVQV